MYYVRVLVQYRLKLVFPFRNTIRPHGRLTTIDFVHYFICIDIASWRFVEFDSSPLRVRRRLADFGFPLPLRPENSNTFIATFRADSEKHAR